MYDDYDSRCGKDELKRILSLHGLNEYVLISYDANYDREYTKESWERRRLGDGEIGQIIDYSDSHGLCFQVIFSSGRAWYERGELRLGL